MNRDLDHLGNITSQPCLADVSKGLKPTSAMIAVVESLQTYKFNETSRLKQLHLEIKEIIDIASYTRNAIKHWMAVFSDKNIPSRVRNMSKSLQIPLTSYNGLSTEEKSRLHILLQFSNYALFLKNVEKDKAFGNKRAALLNLRLKIMRVVCTLRTLLPYVRDIQSYIKQEEAGQMIQLRKMRMRSLKRVICVLAVERMLKTFRKIEVSEFEGSVTIRGNLSK